jgi:hypothetical protein
MSTDRWFQLIVQGTEDDFERFLAGTAAPAGQVIRGTDVHLEPESLAERLRDLVGARSHHLLYAGEAAARALRAALAGAAGLELDEIAEVTGGRFAFRVQTYSAEQRADIRRSCLTPPPGVQLLDFRESTESDPGARGPELFTPAHDYIYRADGVFAGTAPGILEAYRRTNEHDFVHPEPLVLETRPVAPGELGGA